MASTTPARDLNGMILTVRGTKVILDADLAVLYGVPTKVFNQAVKRNLERFPASFRFQLQLQELARLRSQIVASEPIGTMRAHLVTASKKRNLRFLPYAFTEHGALMAATIINPPPDAPRKRIGFRPDAD